MSIDLVGNEMGMILIIIWGRVPIVVPPIRDGQSLRSPFPNWGGTLLFYASLDSLVADVRLSTCPRQWKCSASSSNATTNTPCYERKSRSVRNSTSLFENLQESADAQSLGMLLLLEVCHHTRPLSPTTRAYSRLFSLQPRIFS